VSSTTIEVVRGRLEPDTAEELITFWAEQGALVGDDARRRLPEVVCVLRDGARVAGACSVRAAEVPLIGGRRFWVYRSLLPGNGSAHGPAMIRETFGALAAEFDGEPGSPIGLCVLIGDAAERRRRPEAEWFDPHMVYAGYLDDGRQVRIGYFDDASIARGGARAEPMELQLEHGWALEDRHRVAAFAEQDIVTKADVVEMWVGERALAEEEARRRVDEVVAVATDGDGRLAGVSTAYLQHNDQLRADMWYSRVFVASAHRRVDLSTALALVGRDHLLRRYFSGEDARAIGTIFEVQHEGLKLRGHMARWPPAHFTFIGENARGDHVRVHYFPDAPAPEPPHGSA
jgi:hypothetical protein